MKAAFVGGGAHRLLGILRAALSVPGLFDGGEIFLCDLNVARAESVGRMLMKSPEFKRINCKVAWGSKLEDGLEGADLVGVVLFAGTPESFALGEIACRKRGFISSDNVSPNGAFLGIKGGPILLDIARKMERRCPDAWLVDFANPIAVFSGMVNNHTKIKALGVCQGYTNHQWDLSRLLFSKDEQNPSFDVLAAGLNHLSFIVEGSIDGKSVFELLDKTMKSAWKMPKVGEDWKDWQKENIRRSVTNLRRFYSDLGVLIFSTEGDGMAHLFHEESVENHLREIPIPTRAQVKAALKANAAKRKRADEEFNVILARDLDDAFWSTQGNKGVYAPQHQDIFVRIMQGIAGKKPVKIVTSRLNQGAIAGIKDRTVVEYSQVLQGRKIKSASKTPLQIPPVTHGLISALAEHQTMLGDAIATDDPSLLAKALLAYPIEPFSKNARELYKELAKINRDQMPKGLWGLSDYL